VLPLPFYELLMRWCNHTSASPVLNERPPLGAQYIVERLCVFFRVFVSAAGSDVLLKGL